MLALPLLVTVGGDVEESDDPSTTDAAAAAAAKFGQLPETVPLLFCNELGRDEEPSSETCFFACPSSVLRQRDAKFNEQMVSPRLYTAGLMFTKVMTFELPPNESWEIKICMYGDRYISGTLQTHEIYTLHFIRSPAVGR